MIVYLRLFQNKNAWCLENKGKKEKYPDEYSKNEIRIYGEEDYNQEILQFKKKVQITNLSKIRASSFFGWTRSWFQNSYAL